MGATAKEDDEQRLFRPEYMMQLGEAGFCGIPTSEDFDGYGAGYFEYALVLEEIAKVSASYGVSVAVSGLPQVILSDFGNDEQKQWMPGLARGELLGAFALSSPILGLTLLLCKRQHGSMVIVMSSMVVDTWITHGGYADVYVVMARTGGEWFERDKRIFIAKGHAWIKLWKKRRRWV